MWFISLRFEYSLQRHLFTDFALVVSSAARPGYLCSSLLNGMYLTRMGKGGGRQCQQPFGGRGSAGPQADGLVDFRSGGQDRLQFYNPLVRKKCFVIIPDKGRNIPTRAVMQNNAGFFQFGLSKSNQPRELS